MRCFKSRIFFFKRFFLITPFLLVTGSLTAQRMVWVPDTTVCQNVEFNLPVFISGFEADDSLIAYQLRLDFDPDFTDIVHVTNQGTFTEDWDKPFVNISDSSVFIAGFSAYQKGFSGSPQSRPLIEIGLTIHQDTSCFTSLRLTQAQFFNLDGFVTIDSLKDSYIEVVYNVPPTISGFPDTSFFEDTSLELPLQKYIHDLNNHFRDLQIEINAPYPLTVNIDTAQWAVQIISPENWTGSFWVDVSASDPFSTSATDRFHVITLPVVDPPEPFQLLSPAMDSTFSHFDSFVVFRWKESVNLDTGDVITYRFFLSPDSTFKSAETVQMANISQSMLSIKPAFPDGIYYWGVRAKDQQGLKRWCDQIFRMGVLTGVPDSEKLPRKCDLASPYPNPFNSRTVIRYFLPKSMSVSFKIFDIRGREILTLFDDIQSRGNHSVFWSGKDSRGKALPSGAYFVVMEAEGYRRIRKVMLIQ